MRIGYDAKRLFHNATGLGNYSRSLVKSLATHFPGNTYVLFNPRPSARSLPAPLDRLKTVYPEGIWKKFPSLWRTKGILRDIQRENLDVYHGLSAELPPGISRLPVKSVLTVHDLIFMKYPQWYPFFDRKIYEWKLRRAVREADRIVAISEQTRKDLEELLGVPPEKVEVIYQTCDDVFKKELSETFLKEVKQRYGLPDDYILYVGTVEPRKNALTLVKALKDLPYPAVLVGNAASPYGRRVQEFIRANGIEERVKMLHGLSQEELAALYRLAKVFVYPSEYEGFGIPVIEALYSGTPVITNARGVFPEAAGPGGIYLDDIRNVAEMREKLRYAMENDLGRYVTEGRKYVREKFDERQIARRWNELYRKVSGI